MGLYDNLYTRYGGLLVGLIGAYINFFHKDFLKKFLKNKYSSIYIFACFVYMISVLFSLQYFYFSNHIGSEIDLTSFYEKIYWGVLVAFDRNLYSLAVMYVIFYSLYNETRFGVYIKNFLSSKIFYPIAQLSYSTYLVHWMLMFWLFPMAVTFFKNYFESSTIILFLNGVLGILLSFLGSLILYLLIERPCMEFRNLALFKSFFDKK